MSKPNRDNQLELFGVKAQLYPTERQRLFYPQYCVPVRSKSVPPAAVDDSETEDERADERASVERTVQLPVPKVIIARESENRQSINSHLLALYYQSLKLEQLLLLQKSNERIWKKHRIPRRYWYELRDDQFNRECHLNNQLIDNPLGKEQLLSILQRRKEIKRLLDAYSISLD